MSDDIKVDETHSIVFILSVCAFLFAVGWILGLQQSSRDCPEGWVPVEGPAICEVAPSN